ncbi:hypothetical protein L195_g044247, partial [Trifolium pratense]
MSGTSLRTLRQVGVGLLGIDRALVLMYLRQLHALLLLQSLWEPCMETSARFKLNGGKLCSQLLGGRIRAGALQNATVAELGASWTNSASGLPSGLIRACALQNATVAEPSAAWTDSAARQTELPFIVEWMLVKLL